MPEHREGTPAYLRDLESFLWWNFADSEEWTRWANSHGAHAGAASFDAAMALHRLLRTLEGANNGASLAPRVLKALDTLVERHGVRPRLSTAALGKLTLIPRKPDDIVGRLLASALEAMVRGDWRRFKLCREPACQTSFYDASKNAAKTWCSMETCGARNKMRRYRAGQQKRS